jgi:RNA polymerase sigma-70 factor (ECF subfamily)
VVVTLSSSSITTDPRPDEEIVARVVAGERELYELLMRRHNRRLYRAIRSVLPSDDATEEVMQQAYVQAFTSLAQFEGRASFAAWLTRIAVNAALFHVRRAKREPVSETNDDSSLDQESMSMSNSLRNQPDDAASDVELRRALEGAIDALPEHFRTVFVLRAVEELSVAETAESLGLQEETVKTRFFRARGLLQKSLMDRVDASTKGAFDFHLSRCDRVVEGVFATLALPRRRDS